MAKKIINVNKEEGYKITAEDNESLYVQGLDSCVGLALVEDEGKKRGLAHIYFDGSELDYEKTEKILENMLSEFQDPYAYLVYNRFRYDPKRGYENPMGDYVNRYLIDRKIKIKLIDALEECRGKHIFRKEVVLHNDKMYVLYRNGSGKLLNHPCQEIKFK